MEHTPSYSWPYGGLKQDVSDCKSSWEIMEATGLNWDTEFVPVHTGDGVKLENYKAPIRSLDGKPLGCVVGKDYGRFNNSQALEMMDPLIAGGILVPGAVTVFGDGHRCVGEFHLKQGDFAVRRSNGEDDEFWAHITLLWGHDGMTPVAGGLDLLRRFCLNQIALQLSQGRKDDRWFKFRHSSRVGEREGEARVLINKAIESVGTQQGVMQALADAPLNQRGFTEFAAQLLTGKDDAQEALRVVAETPEGRGKTTLENRFELLSRLYFNGQGNNGADCLDALNSVTEWCDWGKGSRADEDALIADTQARSLIRRAGSNVLSMADYRKDQVPTEAEIGRNLKRFNSNLNGTNADLKARAVRLLSARAEAIAV